MKIPFAKQIENTSKIHNEVIKDNYAWLRDKNWPKVESPEIIEYLELENEYCKSHEDKDFEKIIYNELKARIKEDDQSYPIKRDSFYYFSRVEKNKDYPILYRKKDTHEELLLDCNLLAEGKTSFSIGDIEVSENHFMLAYAYDNDGSERYTIEVRDLRSQVNLSDIITKTIGNIVWNNQNTGFYYIAVDENWRFNKVFFHQLGTNQEDDVLIYHEQDHIFSVSISSSSNHDYLIINTGSSTSNEIHYISLNDDQHYAHIAIKRIEDHLYDLDYLDDNFYLLTNDQGKNFRLVTIKKGDDFVDKNFIEIIPHSKDYYITDLSLYNKAIVVTKNILGLNNIECYSYNDHKLICKVPFAEEVYQADMIFTTVEDEFLRIHYSSLTTPKSVFEYDFVNKDLHVRKIEEIPSGYNKDLYKCERLWVNAKDGVKIPVSIVYKNECKKENMPCVLYGYGSYGLAMPVNFRPNIISLLDRGVIYAIAHIRGGDELGYDWYETAKFLTKKRSFDDFISVAEHLIDNKYTSSDKLSIMGGSAGGMLMGVVVNERSDLFKSMVALVPFVDVLNTMLDDSLPLTPGEFEEWGNPIQVKEYFDYIKSYSPYENVKAQHYPQMLVTAGLTDPRVGYWEAAKWVAKLRATKLDNNIILLKTEMDSGHKGQSGRFKSLEETAMIYSFILKSFNINN